MSSVKCGLVAALFVWIAVFSFSQERNSHPGNAIDFTKPPHLDSVSAGRKLALNYCQGCHLFPEPALLDKKTWAGSVLPNMGYRLGMRKAGEDPYAGLLPAEAGLIRNLNIYPDSALISRAEWEQIVKYYTATAPAEPLPQKLQVPVTNQLSQFKTEYVTLGDKSFPKTTLLKYDKSASLLYVGDAQNELYVLDSNFHVKDTWWTDTPPTDIDFPENAPPRLLTIGVFNPSEQKTGRLMSLDKSARAAASVIHIQSLPRIRWSPR